MASRSGTPTPVNPTPHGRDLTALLLVLWLAWLFPFPAGAESRERMTVPNSAPRAQAGNAATVSREAAIRARVLKTYGVFPLSFEANQGQTDARVKFLSRGRGYGLFLTPTESVLTLRKPAPHQDAKSEIRNPKLGAATPKPEVQAPTVLRMKLTGANPTPRVTGVEELPGKSNYFIGNDPKKWRTNVPNYAKVRYKDLYPGVDLIYYGNQQQLEYDFVVAPGADPRAIRLVIETGESKSANPGSQIRVEANGDLVIHLEGGDVRFRKPVVYQPRERRQLSVVSGQSRPTTDDGQRTTGSSSEFTIQNSELIDGRYVLTATNEIRFEVPTYDRKRPLIIDPVMTYPALSYSTYLGGSDYDQGNAIAVDADGNAYVTGFTYSLDFPTQNRIQGATETEDVFVTKFNAAGSGLIYSTYLGGRAADSGSGIVVDADGNAYVTGVTDSFDFPTTGGAYQENIAGQIASDAFVVKLNAAGSGLVYSTYLGGSGTDSGSGIAVGSGGYAYVTGLTESIDFPNGFESNRVGEGGNADAFVVKVNTTGSDLEYSTYLGGGNWDEGFGIAVDADGNAYVTGSTASDDFPTHNAYQTSLGGGIEDTDAFVVKLTADGSDVFYSTYLGGTYSDYGYGIAVDAAGNAYVTGVTSSDDFPWTENAYQTSLAGGLEDTDAFVSKIDTTKSGAASLIYSTYLGGSSYDESHGIAVDASGSAYVTGSTFSSNFPTASPVQASNAGGVCEGPCSDAFVAKLNAPGSALIFSSYLGGPGEDRANGIAVDASRHAYVTGQTYSTDFPTANAFQSDCALNNDGYCAGDAFVAKLSGLALPLVHLSRPVIQFSPLGVGFTSNPETVTLTNIGDANLIISSIDIETLPPGGPSFRANSAVSSDFFETNDCGTTVTPGQTCTITVMFTPTALSPPTRSGMITITDNAAGSPQHIGLFGNGLPAPAVTLSPPSLAFGSQEVGSSTGGIIPTVTITNTGVGEASLIISDISISSATGDFMFGVPNNPGPPTCPPPVPGFPITLAVDASCRIAVIFHPTILGLQTGQITITDNAPHSPQPVPLTGTGIPAPTTTVIDAPAVTYNSNASVTVTVTSDAGTVTGDVSLSVDGGIPILQELTGGSTIFALTSPSAGDHSLSANYAAQDVFAASSASGTLHVNQATPTVNVTGGTFTYDGNPHAATATAVGVDGHTPVAGAFSFIYTPPGDATIPVNASTTSYQVSASFTSTDSNYSSATGTGSITINKADQTITVSSAAPAMAVYNTTFLVAATASSDLTVSIGVSGVCSLSDGTVTMTSGTGTCTVTFSQAGSPNYNAATPIVENTTAAKATPTVTFTGAPASANFQSTFTVATTTNASTTATITPSGSCSITDATVTMTSGTGTCSLTANWAADSNYLAATATQSTAAARIAPTVTFTGAPASAAYQSAFSVAATTNASTTATITPSGSCSITDATVTMTSGTGTCSLTANWAADSNYLAAAATQSTAALQIAPTVTFTGAPASAAYQSAFSVAATTNASTTATITPSGSCSITDTTVTMTSGTGTCSLTANWAADPNYLAASASQSTTAQKATPVITWSNPTDVVYGTALGDLQLNATASFNGSSVPGVFTYTPLAGTILTAGSNQTLSVTFAPNDTTNFNTATATVQLNVNTKELTITANNAIRQYGQANPVFTASYSGFVNGENSSVLGGTLACTTAATPTSPVTGSPYPITCSGQTSTNYAISYVDGQLTVTKATPTFGNLTASQTINWGTASIMLSGTIAAGSVSPPAGESVAITINGGSQTALIAGSGSFTASFDTHAIPISLTAYTITYSYPGGADFSAASDTGTTLTVQGPLVSLSPTTLTFDTQFIATTSPQQPVTLTNTGNGPLTSPTITTSGDFDQTNNCASGAAPAAHCTINVTFTPTAAGLRTGTLTISDNAPGSPHVVNLTGTGAVGLTLTPSTLEFEGNVDVICPAKDVTVKNIRQTALTITGVTASGPFNIDTNCRNRTLAPGATCLVTVLFLPHEVGTLPGAVGIYSDVTPDPVVLAITGHATPACHLQAASQASTVLRGTASTTFNIADSNPSCFTSTVNLSCADQSPATCSFSAATIRPTEGAVLTLGNLAAVTANDLSFRVVGTASNHSASVNLVVHLSDFSLAANTSRASVTAGQSATYDLSLQPLNGLSGRVNLSCTGVPAGATCSVIPASLTMDGATMASFKVKVTTTARSLGAPGPKPQNLPPFFGPWIGLTGVWWLMALALLASLAGSRRSGRRAVLGLTVALLFVLLWAACAGGSFRQTLSTGTPAGTYTLTLSATYPAGQGGTASDLSHSTSLTLLVQ